ncbi:TIGR00269 family protein [archaeon]|jgi:tRNA-5-methyluridine54 2-sulfurtransferase|nr:TIGR00269 family protein [archaeon]MBT4417413.1 TIGR00269 family protein [archaeon]
MANTKFVEYFEKKVRKTIRKYKLFTKKDKIAVAVSGGKDSTVCLYILKKLGYDLEAITIDANIGNYTKTNLENIKKVCKKYKIKLHVISFREEFGTSLCYMQSILKSKGHDYASCKLCGILKRYLLNKYSKKLKFDFLATGHNLDDEAQTFLMNAFRNDTKRLGRQGPISGITKSKDFVQRVKPLYLLSEEEVKRYSKILKFPVNYEICPCSVNAYRREFINILNLFEEKHPDVKYNLLKFHEFIAEKVKPKKAVKIELCKTCGEPASNDTCKTCQILDELKKK